MYGLRAELERMGVTYVESTRDAGQDHG
jgi:hypothetical protein